MTHGSSCAAKSTVSKHATQIKARDTTYLCCYDCGYLAGASAKVMASAVAVARAQSGYSLGHYLTDGRHMAKPRPQGQLMQRKLRAMLLR